MTRTIVVPLDGSGNAEQAIPYARVLARQSGSPILLVSVVDIPVEMLAWTTANATAMGRELDEWVRDRQRYLDEQATKLEGLEVRAAVMSGAPNTEILAALASVESPIVVMASHGRSGATRLMLGSVANRIVRDARCPVLVVRLNTPLPSDLGFERMLVPLDGSPFSEHTLRRIPELFSEDVHPSLHLLRVVETPAMRAAGIAEPGLPLDYGLVAEYLEAARAEAGEYLDTLASSLREQGHEVTTEVRGGRVVDEILASATDFRADVIAISTHGRGGLSRVIFGSVAERVLHESNHPLLLVRPVE